MARSVAAGRGERSGGAEDVQRVAKKYVPTDNIRIIAVGDAKIADLLKKFGPVETISPDAI